MGNKDHWENVFLTKQPNEVSWFQEYPKTSMDYIEAQNLFKTAAIIDIGGGDSKLVDALLEKGYENISVLDISAAALERAKSRLGANAEKITWIVTDITEFVPSVQYDFWHDRAVFHFLRDETDIAKYLSIVKAAVKTGGHFFLGTFSRTGPFKCSGLEITQHSEEDMISLFAEDFEVVKCFTEDHQTPFNSIQNFQFCGFRRKS